MIQQQIQQCIAALRALNVTDEIIDLCFIPEETETEIEVRGSLLQALADSKMFGNWNDCLVIAEPILSKIFGDEAVNYVVTDWSKPSQDEAEEFKKNKIKIKKHWSAIPHGD